jgi:AcrR family transcriptional regulator
MTQTRRDITREATLREIKETALRLMRSTGTTEVRFADIAREMHMSAPGLYRYYDGRDELVTALIADAYDDLGAAVLAAREAVDPADPGGRLLALAAAYRQWSLEEPQRFALLFGPPLPGYAPPEDGPAGDAARRAMATLIQVAVDAQGAGNLAPPRFTDVPPALAECMILEKHQTIAGDQLSIATHQAICHAFAALQGVVSIEVYGAIPFTEPGASEGLFLGMVRLVADAIGLPEPVGGWVIPAALSHPGRA